MKRTDLREPSDIDEVNTHKRKPRSQYSEEEGMNDILFEIRLSPVPISEMTQAFSEIENDSRELIKPTFVSASNCFNLSDRFCRISAKDHSSIIMQTSASFIISIKVDICAFHSSIKQSIKAYYQKMVWVEPFSAFL